MRILNISCDYLPDRVGGTEIYVHSLSTELQKAAHQVNVCIVEKFYEKKGPVIKTRSYSFEGIAVFVIQRNAYYLETADIYFDREGCGDFYNKFTEYLNLIKPDVVHFHHFIPSDTAVEIRAAKKLGIPVILTYHTPSMSCLVANRPCRNSCDGSLNYYKCLLCVQRSYHVPAIFAGLFASLPKRILFKLGRIASHIKAKGRFLTWLQLPWLVQEYISCVRYSFAQVDHFIALSDWTRNLLLCNNVDFKKISLVPHGVGEIPPTIRRSRQDVLRLGYLGRIDLGKGLDILIEALQLLPADSQVELYVYGDLVNPNKYAQETLSRYRDVKNVMWMGQVLGADKFQALSGLDVLVVPSFWLETGPLVILEAWAVGTAVIGADLGGISELLKEGLGGMLFVPGDKADLARVIKRVSEEEGLLESMRNKIPPVKKIKDVAVCMQDIYRRLIR